MPLPWVNQKENRGWWRLYQFQFFWSPSIHRSGTEQLSCSLAAYIYNKVTNFD
ncbi:unnamed protein product, partial [Prunus brigantina]